ncbi:MAG: hypothetical protein GX605_01330 [Chloroflexi bacterium]|nr:hypothetical protein [Chloroflexota bacterium]
MAEGSTGKASQPRVWGVLILALCLLAFALRVYRLDAQSLWYDEGVTAYLTTLSLPALTAWTADDIQPPLYYALVWGWARLAGTGEWALRFPSVWAGVLAVPLLWWMGQRLGGSRAAGGGCALLAAVSPLHLWYAQEARNYTLVTLLCLAASLALAANLGWPRSGWRRWAPYVLLMTAAVYTHYFAFFCLLFHGMFALLWAALRPGQRAGRCALAAAAAVVAAYLPWLPFVWARWQADVSYWPGSLKLGEAWRKVALSFLGGESLLEAEGLRLLPFYGAALAVSVSVWAATAWKERRRAGEGWPGLWGLAFALGYAVVPVAGLLALALVTPKFNPRYAMLASPGVLLLLGGALGRALALRSGRALCAAPAGAAVLFVVGVSAYAGWNLYHDPAFSKADFRGVARHVRGHAAADETVVLVSGHMVPVWDYYWPGSPRIPVPPLRILDARDPVGWEAAETLNDALAGRGGAWLVLWQDDVVDPSGIVAYLLERGGQPLPVDAAFWHVGLRHYALPPNLDLPPAPQPAQPSQGTFGGQVAFLGLDQPAPGEAVAYWRALQPLADDWLVSLTLVDEQGLVWGQADRRPSSYAYPAFRWEVGEVVLGRYALPAVPGAPPGRYTLRLALHAAAQPDGLEALDAQGASLGRWLEAGRVRLEPPSEPPSLDALAIPQPAAEDVAFGGLQWLGYGLTPRQGEPGAALTLTAFWEVQQPPPAALGLRAVWRQSGRELESAELPWGGGGEPPAAWPVGGRFRTQARLRLPLAAQAGAATLELELRLPGETEPTAVVTLGQVEVQPSQRRFELPAPRWPSGAQFGEGIVLLGADLPPATISPGQALPLTLHWQARAEMERSYTVFVHLLGPDGRVVDQADHVPNGGARPTNTWLPPEVLTEGVTLQAPAGAATGEYWIEVGWYDAALAGLPRLPAAGAGGAAPGDRVLLGPFALGP